MRASSLSNLEIIQLLNGHFVSVLARNADYREDGAASAEERAEYGRIYRAFLDGGYSAGTVHAYVVGSDGQPIDSLHVAEAAKPDKMLAMLKQVADARGAPAGDPLVAPAPQAAAPERVAGELLLHVTARYLVRDGDELVPALTDDLGRQGGGWGALPSEEWISFQADDVHRLLPMSPPRLGLEWEVDPDLAARLLNVFYPPSEDNDLSHNRIDRQSLTATIASFDGDTARATIRGSLKMKHPFYPNRDDDNFVEAELTGYMDFSIARQTVLRFRLATESAQYAGQSFGVAVRSHE